ncbi:MAG: DUF222 domain-containing protein [Microbacterium sp.]
MAFFTDITDRISAMRDLVGDVAQAEELPSSIGGLDDAAVVTLLQQATELVRAAEQVSLVAAGVITRRSQRTAGHSGLAQSRGHRNSASLIQDITGTSKADAARQSRVGESLLASEENPKDDSQGNDSQGDVPEGATPPARTRRWDDPLRTALFRRTITNQQHDAIRRGLGEPPEPEGATDAVIVGFREAWALAAEQLASESAHRTLEELRSAARTIRDQLDPDGAEARFLERHAARSFRLWTDADGGYHASAALDDDGYLWLKTVMDAALRPRRGGPRFVDAEEKARGAALVGDPRTNEQLAYDLIIDVLRAGTLADAETVFGTRQAGVRLVQQVDTKGNASRTALTEDGLIAIPASFAGQRICDSGTAKITIDTDGSPLDVGREHRLFTAKQRMALSARDGGCRWKGCDRPASYCEAHHIDMYSEGGRTDIDRGILLCRFHHMELHHGQWRITREGQDDFVLRHRSGEQTVLKPRLALEYAWSGIDPPPKRFGVAA